MLVVYQAVSAGDDALAGEGIANPLRFIRPAEAILRHIGETEAADAIGRALADGVRTRDVGGQVTTEGMIDVLIERLG